MLETSPLIDLMEFLEESSKEQQAKAFRVSVAQENPELFQDLERQARLALVGLRNHQKPKQKVDNLKTLFSWNKEMDPTQSADTYGVRAFITALSNDKLEAGKAKRFYDRTIDQFFKQMYGKAGEKQKDQPANIQQQNQTAALAS